MAVISIIGLVPIVIVVSPIVIVMVPIVIVMVPPIVVAVIRIIPMVGIPIPDIHPVIIIWVTVKEVVCSRIDVDCVAVVIHEPVIYSAIILQIPIKGT